MFDYNCPSCKTKKDFTKWLRTGTQLDSESIDDDGGYYIPTHVVIKRKGFLGWFFRLIKNKRGFVVRNFVEELKLHWGKKI